MTSSPVEIEKGLEQRSEKHQEKSELSSHGSGSAFPDDIDLYNFHEKEAGRLIVDPEEARIELGDAVASRLKLSRDGKKVLWPQPTDSPNDPLNWSDRQKTIHLVVITLAAIVPDFDSGIGIAAIFQLAEQFGTTPNEINNLTSNWSIFLLGWGGMAAVMLIRRYGRLPVLFWSQVLALGFLIGCTFAKTLPAFAAMRCLAAFFGSAPQVTGLYIVTDLYPFHLQARKINIWTMGFIVSPFISPFLFGFLVARTTWRWAYGIGCIYGAIVVILIAVFMHETMYDRGIKPIPEAPKGRIQSLVGITGIKMAKYRASWPDALLSQFRIFWRPQILGILLYEGVVFGFGIGINVTNAVFLGEPAPIGFGFSPYAIAAMYATPIVAVIIGELTGRFLNDWILDKSVARNKGVFEAENRLWACYLGMPLFVVGFVVLGAGIQEKLNIGSVIMGWGIAEVAIMVTTVAIYSYVTDCFPKYQGEVSALINLARTLGGFAVPYFQLPWAEKHGPLQTFGCEAAIVAGLFFLVIPWLQLKGKSLRVKYSLT